MMDTVLERSFPSRAVAITPADGSDLPHVALSIYVGVAGDIKVTTLGGDQVTFKNVPVGDLVGRFIRVWATGTTATNLLARYSS